MTQKIDYEKIKIPTPEGEITLSELIEREVKARLEKRRVPVGLREDACRLFVQKMYNIGGVVKTKNELRKIANDVAAEISKKINKDFKFSMNIPIKRGYIAKIKRVVEREGQKITVWFYTYTPDAIKKFLTPEQIAHPKTVTPEEVEKAIKEA